MADGVGAVRYREASGLKVLVTGITGFAGAHLAALLARDGGAGVELHGTKHAGARISPVFRPEGVSMHSLDITDAAAVDQLLSGLKPDVIYHMAAFVSVARSFQEPARTFQTNVVGTIDLLESVKRHCPDAKVVVPGSAESYGRVDPGDMPIKESQPLRARNPYGMSKASQEMVSLYYHEAHGLKVFPTRSFHYTGPGQPTGFVCSDFAKQIADMEAGRKEPVMSVGNLRAKRDFLDIRDVVRSYTAIVGKGRPGVVYNVCRGESVAISDILDMLVGMSNAAITVEVDPAKLRPIDVPDFVGDNTRIRQDTSWAPEIPLHGSLRDVLDFWRRAGT